MRKLTESQVSLDGKQYNTKAAVTTCTVNDSVPHFQGLTSEVYGMNFLIGASHHREMCLKTDTKCHAWRVLRS